MMRRGTNTALGDAIFMRLSPTTGEPVDFVWSEAVRALCYVNDLMGVYPLEESCRSAAERAEYFDAIQRCFPFYMPTGEENDTMGVDGFSSADGRRECRLMADGSLRKVVEDFSKSKQKFRETFRETYGRLQLLGANYRGASVQLDATADLKNKE